MWQRVVAWWGQVGSTRQLTRALLWEQQETNRLLRELIERQTGFVALQRPLPGTMPTPGGIAWNQRTGFPLPPEPGTVPSAPAPPSPSASGSKPPA